ncbi:MAG: hypothetical protein ACK5O2_09730 [Microthrixaceae bacterium]
MTAPASHPPGSPQMARGYVKASGVGKEGACHLFRHTMATDLPSELPRDLPFEFPARREPPLVDPGD